MAKVVRTERRRDGVIVSTAKGLSVELCSSYIMSGARFRTAGHIISIGLNYAVYILRCASVFAMRSHFSSDAVYFGIIAA